MNIRRTFPEDIQGQELENIRRVAAGDMRMHYETRRVNKEGQTFSVWLTASFLADNAGQAYALAVTQRFVRGKNKK